MADAKEVRLGVIGLGNIGAMHCRNLRDGKVPRARLTAVCDAVEPARARFTDVPGFADSAALIRSGLVDAVLVATPHYQHTGIGIDALGQGLHLLVEKPISVHKADAVRLIAAWEQRTRREQVFAAMFNQRTDPRYITVRDLLRRGELGEIRRVNWIITDWFRSEAYYASGGWRATWAGEGGGVLINQCPHQLDLLQWMCGMPCKVRGFCQLGRWHAIEVEDAVTAYLEWPNGATGVFVTTTGEAPGTNRLEIAAERGRLVVEEGRIRFTRNLEPMTAFSRSTTQAFGKPPVWNVEIPADGTGGQHVEILANFVAAILDGAPLLAPGAEGLHSVELGNAMLLSSLLDRSLDLPLDSALVDREFATLIASSKYQKKVVAANEADIAKSFGR